MPKPEPTVGNNVLGAIDTDRESFCTRDALDAHPPNKTMQASVELNYETSLYELAEERGQERLDSPLYRIGKHVDSSDSIGHFDGAPIL